MDTNKLKQLAAEQAVERVESGMVVGLGTGSTAAFAVRRLAALLSTGQLTGIVGIPSSNQTASQARQLGIPLTTLEAHTTIDLTIDGADEATATLDLIKGGGGALLREKIVAQASRRVIIVVDESKLSPALGTVYPLPVEVIPFGWPSQAAYLKSMGAQVTLRQRADGTVFRTDEGNFILDCRFGQLREPGDLAVHLQARAGIVEHGMFLGLATELIVAGPGGVQCLARTTNQPNDSGERSG